MQCEGCHYNRGYENKSGCMAFTERPQECWNHTTTEDGEKREKEIKNYANVLKRP